MVDLSISIPTLLILFGFTSAIPFNSRDEICHLSPSFAKRRAEALFTAPETHVLDVSTMPARSICYTAADPASVLSSLISSPVNTVTVMIPASGYATLPSLSAATTETTQAILSQSENEPEPSPIQTVWSAPPQMTDLSSFGITYFPSGQQNVEVVSSLPFDSSRNPGDNDHSLIRVLYPAHSVNPAKSPVGGASFYASPIELSSAINVSLQYSIFFPAGFNWVRGGKLPGLYGGRTGCSGGADAEDCFSTRLMWRAKGAGELYLVRCLTRNLTCPLIDISNSMHLDLTSRNCSAHPLVRHVIQNTVSPSVVDPSFGRLELGQP